MKPTRSFRSWAPDARRATQAPQQPLAPFQKLIAEIAGVDGEVKRIQRAIANTIVGQMLPPGVVKGGTAMKLRLGEAHSRFTPDLDAARKIGLTESDYMDMFALRLSAYPRLKVDPNLLYYGDNLDPGASPSTDGWPERSVEWPLGGIGQEWPGWPGSSRPRHS